MSTTRIQCDENKEESSDDDDEDEEEPSIIYANTTCQDSIVMNQHNSNGMLETNPEDFDRNEALLTTSVTR